MRLGKTALYFSQPTYLSALYGTFEETGKSSHQPKKTTNSVTSSNRQFNVDQFPFADDNKPKDARSRPNSFVDDAKMYLYYEKKVETVIISNSTKKSTKRTITSLLHSTNTKRLIYYVGNTRSGLGQAHTCRWGVKPVNKIYNHTLLITGAPMERHI